MSWTLLKRLQNFNDASSTSHRGSRWHRWPPFRRIVVCLHLFFFSFETSTTLLVAFYRIYLTLIEVYQEFYGAFRLQIPIDHHAVVTRIGNAVVISLQSTGESKALEIERQSKQKGGKHWLTDCCRHVPSESRCKSPPPGKSWAKTGKLSSDHQAADKAGQAGQTGHTGTDRRLTCTTRSRRYSPIANFSKPVSIDISFSASIPSELIATPFRIGELFVGQGKWNVPSGHQRRDHQATFWRTPLFKRCSGSFERSRAQSCL